METSKEMEAIITQLELFAKKQRLTISNKPFTPQQTLNYLIASWHTWDEHNCEEYHP